MRVIKTGWVCSAMLMVLSLGLLAVPATAGVGVSPTSYNFGSVSVNSLSAPTTIMVTNNGNHSIPLQQVSSSLAQFVVTGPALPMYLQPQQSVSYQVVFSPTAAANFSGAVQFVYGRHSGNTVVVAVSGTGVSATPAATFQLAPSASSLSFGNVLVGASASQAVSLSNTGNSSVTISQVAATGTGFSVSGGGGVTLAPGQNVAVNVQFAPAAVGNAVGSVSVLSNATNSPATIALAGAGVQPMIAVVPSAVSFGSVTVGVTNSQTLTISNPGTANLSVTQVAASAGFLVSTPALPLTVAPGKSATMTVSYAPTVAGAVSGLMTIVSNAPNSPLNVSLSGTGVTQLLQLSASPTSLSFGSLTTGTSASHSVALTNTGNSSVTVSQISVTGTGFSFSGIVLPITLAAGQSTSFTVSATPLTAGTLTGVATITSTATNSPTTVALSGTATAPVSHSANLSWSPGTTTAVGYHVYRGSVTGGPYTLLDPNLQTTMNYADTTVASGQTYYYVVTDVDATGAESTYSNEAMALIP